MNVFDDYSRDSNISTESIINSITYLKGVMFWGAQTYMYINIIHFFMCILVVIIYCALSDKNKNLYNRLVLRHNICLLLLGGILTLLGYCHMYKCCYGNLVTRLFWLSLQYFTNATVFWLNVICFDMTLVITRLSWIFNIVRREDENQKLIIYSLFVWCGALIPTLTAAIFEFVPLVPNDFFMKVNFIEASKGPRPVVNMYFFLVPAHTLFFNNLLFVFTTYSIVKIQQSTKLAIKNQESLLRKQYFLFLRLYVFMGAPWFFGTVLACFNKLVVLKMCRLMQPILWLIMLASRSKIRQHVIYKFLWKKFTWINKQSTKRVELNDVINLKPKNNLVTN
ncbi:uncharacterized protein LOC106642741 [Copidosoma floridanum]|uniref:uncharacterized protein LOC106642741 n=1 Tax=Copidosoma floridanum TaxID=29053 RepID=UPI000C6FA9F3|nr:uncharacterized protein LOC106642741 [Copidosoma floridanum]